MNYKPQIIATSILYILALLIVLLVIDNLVFQYEGDFPDDVISLESYQLNTKKSEEIYKQWSIRENQKIYNWHLRSTKIIFWVSILVAVIGMSFSFWQFTQASSDAKRAAEADEIEIKTEFISLAFKSRSIAALVMFISIAYLLIYVVLVYPLNTDSYRLTDQPQNQNTSIDVLFGQSTERFIDQR